MHFFAFNPAEPVLMHKKKRWEAYIVVTGLKKNCYFLLGEKSSRFEGKVRFR